MHNTVYLVILWIYVGIVLPTLICTLKCSEPKGNALLLLVQCLVTYLCPFGIIFFNNAYIYELTALKPP